MSSKLGTTEAIGIVDELIASLSPPSIAEIEEKAFVPFKCDWSFLSPSKMREILVSMDRNEFAIIDVRDDIKDFLGGNLVSAKNVPVGSFRNNLGVILNEYHGRKLVVIHCMYSQQRGVRSAKWYVRALEELVNNYLNPQINLEHIEYHEPYYSLSDVLLNDEVVECLRNQRVCVLKGGFNRFLNEYHEEHSQLFENVDEKYWKIEEHLDRNGVAESRMVHIYDC